MCSNRSGILAVIILLLTLRADTVLANGINPPRPSGSTVVTAICKDRNDHERKIFRARIKYGKQAADKMKLRIENTVEKVPLSDIAAVTLEATSADSDGYAKASLVRRGDTEKTKVMLQVKQGGKAVRLTGFTEDGAVMSIDLIKCGTMEFSSGSSGSDDDAGQSHQPVMKR